MSSKVLNIGDKAPAFEMKAAVSGRKVAVPADRILVLLFHNQKTIDAVRVVQRAVREAAYPAEIALVASVLDLQRVPRLLRGAAESAIEKVYRGIAEKVPPPYEVEDYVVILPDWKGSITAAFGVIGIDAAACVIIVDRQGVIAGRYQGQDNLGVETVALLQRLHPVG